MRRYYLFFLIGFGLRSLRGSAGACDGMPALQSTLRLKVKAGPRIPSPYRG